MPQNLDSWVTSGKDMPLYIVPFFKERPDITQNKGYYFIGQIRFVPEGQRESMFGIETTYFFESPGVPDIRVTAMGKRDRIVFYGPDNRKLFMDIEKCTCLSKLKERFGEPVLHQSRVHAIQRR